MSKSMLLSILLLLPSCVTATKQVTTTDKNLDTVPGITFEGEHFMYAHAMRGGSNGRLLISEDELGLSIKFLNIEAYNPDHTLGYMPVMHVLANKQTSYTFFVEAYVDYDRSKNLKSFDGEPIKGTKHTKLFLLNTGEQLYLAWTIFDKNKKVIMDQTYYSKTEAESACVFTKQRLICK